MPTIEIEVDPKLYSVSEFSNYLPTPNTTFPRLIQCVDGQLRVYLTPTVTVWVMAADAPKVKSYFKDTKDSPAAPNVGISESTLLKAIALAQKPDLAMNILKQGF